MKYFTLLSALLLFLSLPTLSLSAEKCNPHDKKVLLQIKQHFNNPYLLASWDSASDCCDWYQVECDPTTNRIISLTIFAGDLSGTIPDTVGDLPYLQTLIFRKLSNITGTIPSAITKLTNLQMVRLSWTNLSGPIPSFLSQLKNLNYLDLSFNNLTGSIPPSLAKLPNLGTLHLDRNKLTGSIPESFGHFTGSAVGLYLSHNNLTGPIPKSLGYLNFSILDFSRNKLTGDLSFLFGLNKTIDTVDFSRNMFKFDLSNVVFPASLTSLDLNHNAIYGSLPEGLTGLYLQYLNVSYNRLCGKIPTGGTGRLQQRFGVTEYFHNRCLCGAPLPACK